VYRAFLEADALVKWMAPHGCTAKVLELDARVGGKYRMSFTNFSAGQSHSFGGTYLELVPHERNRNTDVFDDPNLPGELMVSVYGRAMYEIMRYWDEDQADWGEDERAFAAAWR
jgi:uncharacterized protein YndB with AHSA1/START domain